MAEFEGLEGRGVLEDETVFFRANVGLERAASVMAPPAALVGLDFAFSSTTFAFSSTRRRGCGRDHLDRSAPLPFRQIEVYKDIYYSAYASEREVGLLASGSGKDGRMAHSF